MDSLIKKENLIQLAEYQKSLYNEPKLRYLFFELTDCCNLNCMHCGSKCTSSNRNYLDFELIERTLSSVRRGNDPSEIMICITGGEPLLHPDIYKTVYIARQMGFSVGITSNGTLIDKKRAEMLVKAGLNTITISLDGLGDTHDKFRCSQGAFEKAVNGIRFLKQAGIEPQVLTVVHKNNISQLEDIYQFLQKEDICSWRLVNIDPIGRAATNNSLLLEGEDLKYLFDYIRAKRFDENCVMDVTTGCSHFLTYEFENEVRDYYFQCGAGTVVASIMANGDIGACLDIERNQKLIQGNVYRDDFMDVWQNKFRIFRRDRSDECEKCRDCKNKNVCLGDSAHTWDFDKDEPYYCVADMLKEA